eukprot:2338634-Rhodomonas_salina.1
MGSAAGAIGYGECDSRKRAHQVGGGRCGGAYAGLGASHDHVNASECARRVTRVDQAVWLHQQLTEHCGGQIERASMRGG